jgi:hypothetical protein
MGRESLRLIPRRTEAGRRWRQQIRERGWPAVKAAALWLREHAWTRFRDNLTQGEQREFLELVRKMKLRQSNLSPKEQARLRALVLKALWPSSGK